MAVPEYYESMEINIPLMKLGQRAADLGITRVIPGLAESDAIKTEHLPRRRRIFIEHFFITEHRQKQCLMKLRALRKMLRS